MSYIIKCYPFSPEKYTFLKNPVLGLSVEVGHLVSVDIAVAKINEESQLVFFFTKTKWFHHTVTACLPCEGCCQQLV